MEYIKRFSYNIIPKFNHTRTFNSCSAIRANTVYTYNLCTTISKLCISFRCTIAHSHAPILTHFLSSLTFFTMLVRVHFDSSRLVLSRLASLLTLALLSSLSLASSSSGFVMFLFSFHFSVPFDVISHQHHRISVNCTYNVKKFLFFRK